MSLNVQNHLPRILKHNEAVLLSEWIAEQMASGLRREAIREAELRDQCAAFLAAFTDAMQSNTDDIKAAPWSGVKEQLAVLSKNRSIQGFSPSETAVFVFSLKQPLFKQIQADAQIDVLVAAQQFWLATRVLDKLGLHVMEVYQKSREEIIARQQAEMLELSTPVVKLWDGILALPMIGTLDSSRTQVVMETLLQRIVETGSDIAIIDITGVPTVDTLVAQHLLKTVTAARLMGAECIISGIRPQIAATIVHLGVDLGNVITKASLADAFVLALKKLGRNIGQSKA